MIRVDTSKGKPGCDYRVQALKSPDGGYESLIFA